jgi:hypothetical protein
VVYLILDFFELVLEEQQGKLELRFLISDQLACKVGWINFVYFDKNSLQIMVNKPWYISFHENLIIRKTANHKAVTSESKEAGFVKENE